MAEAAQVLAKQMETPKSTVGIFELPCGYLDEQNVLHNEVQVREITGVEEDILASDKIKDNQKFDEMLCGCLVRVGTITDKTKIREVVKNLLVGDRAFLMFAIRRVTLGDDFPFNEVCPECKAERLYNVDLNSLEVYKMPEPTKRIYDKTLPSGKSIRFKMVYGKDEPQLDKLRKSMDALSLGILFRLELLDGKPPQLADVKALGLRARNEIRDAMTAVDGGIDTEVEMQCPECKTEFKRDIEIGQPGFFFPSATQKHKRTTSST